MKRRHYTDLVRAKKTSHDLVKRIVSAAPGRPHFLIQIPRFLIRQRQRSSNLAKSHRWARFPPAPRIQGRS